MLLGLVFLYFAFIVKYTKIRTNLIITFRNLKNHLWYVPGSITETNGNKRHHSLRRLRKEIKKFKTLVKMERREQVKSLSRNHQLNETLKNEWIKCVLITA